MRINLKNLASLGYEIDLNEKDGYIDINPTFLVGLDWEAIKTQLMEAGFDRQRRESLVEEFADRCLQEHIWQAIRDSE